MLTAKYASTAKEAPKVVTQVKSAASPVLTLTVVSPSFTFACESFGVAGFIGRFGVVGFPELTATNPSNALFNIAYASFTTV